MLAQISYSQQKQEGAGMRGVKRRGTLKCIALLCTIIFLISVTGCGSTDSTSQESAPVKIGLLVPYTGVFASNGYDITNGMELYFDEVGWQAGGRKIELIKEDSEMNGQIGLQKVRRLVEGDKIDILAGVVSSTVAYAIRDYVVGNKIPFIISNAGATDLTREKRSKYIFRASFFNGQFEYPMGTYVYEQMGIKKVVVMAPDYAAGHEKATGFMDGFKAAGGEVIQEIYPPLGTTDFGPYLTQLKDADAVWAHFSGTDSIRYVKQYSEYRINDRMPLLSSGDLVDESSLIYQLDSALGIVSSLHYSAALKTPENEEFVKKFMAKYNESPDMFSVQGYDTARVIVEALNKTGGDTSDTEKLLDSIRSVKFQSPRGPFRFDPVSQNVIFNTYIRKVEKVDGVLVNSVLYTIPNVSDYVKLDTPVK
jgi:branched-chain amino acid transport system substrate-binding protein